MLINLLSFLLCSPSAAPPLESKFVGVSGREGVLTKGRVPVGPLWLDLELIGIVDLSIGALVDGDQGLVIGLSGQGGDVLGGRKQGHGALLLSVFAGEWSGMVFGG